MTESVQREYFEIPGSDKRPISMDVHIPRSSGKNAIAIFAHGYKGFKDFGAWSLVGDEFARNDVIFVRFNFSHNGVTPQTPLEFSDLEAFGRNNFAKEIDDFKSVIDFIAAKAGDFGGDSEKIGIIGHSRGGGMAILTAGESGKVKKLITWASIESTGMRMPKGKELEAWRKHGVAYIFNARTKQQMPHYFEFYEDFEQNKARYDIRNAISKLDIPILIIHGEEDETVDVEAARLLHSWAGEKSKLVMIPATGHTFGSKHPWESKEMPEGLAKAVKESIGFMKEW